SVARASIAPHLHLDLVGAELGGVGAGAPGVDRFELEDRRLATRDALAAPGVAVGAAVDGDVPVHADRHVAHLGVLRALRVGVAGGGRRRLVVQRAVDWTLRNGGLLGVAHVDRRGAGGGVTGGGVGLEAVALAAAVA